MGKSYGNCLEVMTRDRPTSGSMSAQKRRDVRKSNIATCMGLLHWKDMRYGVMLHGSDDERATNLYVTLFSSD